MGGWDGGVGGESVARVLSQPVQFIQRANRGLLTLFFTWNVAQHARRTRRKMKRSDTP